MELQVELGNDIIVLGEVREVQNFQKKIQQQMLARLGFNVKVHLVEPAALEKGRDESGGGSSRRVLDLR